MVMTMGTPTSPPFVDGVPPYRFSGTSESGYSTECTGLSSQTPSQVWINKEQFQNSSQKGNIR
eukprot:CAMPEP_0114369304 /NCGR_PEP_ID=MMETSP0101-20121206/31578_1 /TAXON_ID=38822 ORGANISM="Pteridomonas danica, Strain PT" /NCGR_SAMPLE_ID=MMETSP0101 /ASSEMBLY_ACC=CAM_ASM_000211 /LENGTH=62 /DNA_ID=CAMNT_0001520103 /DNA_START=78 /DNA_END=262 /DNA_ORIENTATION=+